MIIRMKWIGLVLTILWFISAIIFFNEFSFLFEALVWFGKGTYESIFVLDLNGILNNSIRFITGAAIFIVYIMMGAGGIFLMFFGEDT